MKKAFVFAALFAVALQASAFAAEKQGTVKSVTAAENKLELTTEAGDEAVMYSAETTWDEGVTDPSTLVGKTVKVMSNDETQAVESVLEVK